MPQFRYEGTTLENKSVHGTIEAASHSDGYAKLKSQNIYAHSLNEQNLTSTRKYRLKNKELAEFSRQIGTMHSAGIPIVRALDILKERVTKPKILRIYDELSQSVLNGAPLSEAMDGCNGAFPEMMVHMFRIGEATGHLDEVAAKMASNYDSAYKIRSKIMGAMIYPAILCLVTLTVIILLFTFVLPKIFELITSGGGELTGLTKAMVVISDVLVNQWYLVLITFAGIALLVRQLMRKYAEDVDRFKLKLPLFGRLLSIIYTGTFARTLSSLYGSGMSMIEAVDMSAKVINNRYLEGQFSNVVRHIQNGNSLSDSIEELDGLEKKLISAIHVGEETGRLEVVLAQISQEYEYESATAIERMLTFVEPMMLVVMGLVIALVLVSVMGPMTQMYGAIG